MNKMYLLSTYDKNELNAGPKAQMDIEYFLEKKYKIKKIVIPYSQNFSLIKKIIMKIKKLIVSLALSIRKNYVIIQYPFNSNFNFTKKIKNKILIIHDLNSLRFKKDTSTKLDDYELNELNSSKYIICHNDKMKEVLISNKIDSLKIITLELFDYKVDKIDNEKTNRYKNKKIIFYAGNLSRRKSPFIYQLKEEKMQFALNLYGKGIERDISKKIIYKGTFKPDDLSTVEGDLGLIWDGNYDESDENEMFKNYTKFNNPHKLSCCLAKGVPVIVWRKAAIASFVEKYNLGYIIDNIYDINSMLFDDYKIKKENAEKISYKVRNGFYIITAFDKIWNDVFNTKDILTN